jgi:hypothetical protein
MAVRAERTAALSISRTRDGGFADEKRKDSIVMMKDRPITATHRLRATVHFARLAFIATILGAAASACGVTGSAREGSEPAASAGAPATDDPTSPVVVAEGQRVFRFDTFGDEQLWTDTLHLNEVVEKHVDPTTALKVGLKVDADAHHATRCHVRDLPLHRGERVVPTISARTS